MLRCHVYRHPHTAKTSIGVLSGLSIKQSRNCLVTVRLFSIQKSLRSSSGKISVYGNNLNTAPIEFRPNVAYTKEVPSEETPLLDTARKALRCTNDVTEDNVVAKVPPIPFNVKLVNKDTRAERIHHRSQKIQIRKDIIDPYLQLTKPRLTMLVMLSAICSYALTPYSASVSQLMCLTVGTTFCSGAANSINMGREPDFDRQMVRTQARPVVRGIVTPARAFKFAAVMGTSGVFILYAGVNPTVAALGAFNIILYGWIYTSLKRTHIINTWVGAVVGALPPMMGWASSTPLSHPGVWCLAGLLYAWQFPHFNTLSHNIRNEYKNAGYVMTAWKNPLLNARVALRYSLLMFPLCAGLSYFNVTDWYYQIDSGIINACMTYWAFKFNLQQKRNYSPAIKSNTIKLNKGLALANVYARKTFWVSIIHLPLILILAILHKKGRWDWLYDDKDRINKQLRA